MRQVLLSAVWLSIASALFAQTVPSTINYQGRLTDNTPSQTPLTATAQMQFAIWDDAAAGSPLWQEPAGAATLPVAVTGGIFSVQLGGSGVPVPASLFSGGAARWLQITVNGEALAPRQAISANGYANQAESAATAASATYAAGAGDSAALGGAAAVSWQMALNGGLGNLCGSGQFLKGINQDGTHTCVTANSALFSPLSMSGLLSQPIISGSNSGAGDGVYGENTSITSNTFGVHGKISSTTPPANSAAIRGECLSTNGFGFGVWGSHAGFGPGVYGTAAGTTPGATGVWGRSFGSTGGGRGVAGNTLSPAGYGGYFSNDAGGTGLFANSSSGVIFEAANAGTVRYFIDAAGSANFGSTVRQMLNLWGTPDGNGTAAYGIGVQAATEYYRAAAGGGFAWYQAGTHSNIQNDPGAGGTALMSLSSSGQLALPFLGSAGATALCRNASNQISTCSSSLRYKTNLKPFSGGLELLDRLKPITFDWKADHMPDVGFGAEDVAAVNPLFVTYNAQGQVEGVKYDRINVLLVNGVRELQDQIKSQQSEIEALKAIVCADHPGAGVCGPGR